MEDLMTIQKPVLETSEPCPPDDGPVPQEEDVKPWLLAPCPLSHADAANRLVFAGEGV